MYRLLAHVRRQGVAYLALFVALGGTSYAAFRLPKNSVGTKQLKNGAVTAAKVKKGTLKGVDFAKGQIPDGPRGLTGATGPAGPAGSTGAAGAQGPGGTRGPKGDPGSFATQLPGGETIRGAYSVGAGTGLAIGLQAFGSISFVTDLGAEPEVVVVAEGESPPIECPGSVLRPEAEPGFLCIFEEKATNTSGVTVSSKYTFGVTITVESTGVGAFASTGTWAATAPIPSLGG